MKLALGLALALLTAQDVRPREETDAQRRARLTEQCAQMDGWQVKELGDYFLVTDVDDRKMIDELVRRVSATRSWIYVDLDPSYRLGGPGEPGPTIRDPDQARSKTVLRVCRTQSRYDDFGVVLGSNGTYLGFGAEIVLNGSLDIDGRAELFRTAQSLVVCEMFDRVLGRDAQAPWFQCGLQDYIAGFGFSGKKLKRQPHPRRLAQIRLALHGEQLAPLQTLCAMGAAAYDGANDLHLDAEITLAQGWSFMWFLMTAEKTTYRGRGILDRYLIRWKHDHDVAAATAFAFEGVDWDVLEREWRACVEKIR